MDVVIPLTPAEEARLCAVARQVGLSPVQLIKQLTLEHLPPVPVNGEEEEDLDAKLRRWQEQDGIPLFPDVPAHILFAQWAEEDAKMTDEEREAEDRLWDEIEKSLLETEASHGLELR